MPSSASPPIPNPRSCIASALLLCTFLLTACEVDEAVDEEAIPTELCAPTGEMLEDTGIVLGPAGCEKIALQDLGNAQTWFMHATWNVEGAPVSLVLLNKTTGAYYADELFNRQSLIPIHLGAYDFDGLRVSLGDNTIEYRIWRQVFGETEEPVYEEVQAGELVLEIELEQD